MALLSLEGRPISAFHMLCKMLDRTKQSTGILALDGQPMAVCDVLCMHKNKDPVFVLMHTEAIQRKLSWGP